MGLMDERVYKITPLLMQIASYAYGDIILNDFDERYYNKFHENIDSPICDVIRNCFNYIDELASNDCHHPTVLMFKDLMCGSNLYEDITNNLSYSTGNLTGELKERIIDFLNNVDEPIIEYKDSFDERLYKTLDNVKSWKDLITLFGIYGRSARESQLLVQGGFGLENTGECWIKVYGKNSRDAYYTEEFYKIIGYIEKKLDRISAYEDSDIFDALSEIKDNFEEYRAYHYEYIKSMYKEAKIFEKCHKM